MPVLRLLRKPDEALRVSLARLSAVQDFDALDLYGRSLPHPFYDRIARFHRKEDRYRGILGKWLLSRQLVDAGLPFSWIKSLAVNPAGRPFLEGVSGIDFNVSHSEDVVVCAVALGGRVGIDVEAIRPIDCRGFRSLLPEALWREAGGGTHGDASFFRCWTRFESAVKAEGCGLAAPGSQLKFEQRSAWFAGRRWFLHEINVAAGYCCHLASDLADAVPSEPKEYCWKG
ncbi:MAG TPA: 4'-phosphopantetheinyl transferase superfamily protein [Bryobacteraceae bacterium]